MLSGYRTLAETGRVLGVSAQAAFGHRGGWRVNADSLGAA